MEHIAALKIALRVLHNITVKRRHPDPSDIQMIRAYAGPGSQALPIDELASSVIRKAINAQGSGSYAARALARLSEEVQTIPNALKAASGGRR